MFPILPTPGLQAEAHRSDRGRDDEEAHAQKFGRVVRVSDGTGRTSRPRLILLVLGVIITLAVVAFAI